jgi:RimJ/RimL family protein N-acetyltransferase
VIAPFEHVDADRFVDFLTDPVATEFVFREGQKTADGAREFLGQIIASYSTETPYFVYAMRPVGGDGFVGTCGASGLPYEGIFELFCCVLTAHRRQGYAIEASRALVDYCFANYAVHEFRAYVNPDNPSAPGLARRMGMSPLGPGEHPVYGDQSYVYALRKGEEGRR